MENNLQTVETELIDTEKVVTPVGSSPIQQLRQAEMDYREQEIKEMEKAYSHKAIWLRKRFILAYLESFNAKQAYLKVRSSDNPVTPAYASKAGHQILSEKYCRYLLEKYLDDIREDELITRQQVLIGLQREANDFSDDSSQTARVAALKELSKILGMQIERKMNLNVNATAPAPVSAEERDNFLEKFKNEFTA